MNAANDLSDRLLKLFPVKDVKIFFNCTKVSQSEIISEAIQHSTPQAIKAFSLNSIDTTRQHIYFYSLQNDFNRTSFNDQGFPYAIANETVVNGKYIFEIMPLIDHDVTIVNPFSQHNIKFLPANRIFGLNKVLCIQFTMLEKDFKAYFPGQGRVVDVNRTNTEKNIINEILAAIAPNIGTQMDVNRGIKYLWDNGDIDSKVAKWKKNRSMATETMDAGFTVRNEYPDVYQAMTSAPLKKMVFKYLKNDQLLCDHFAIDPTIGEMSIATFSLNNANVNQIQNVISEIIRNN